MRSIVYALAVFAAVGIAYLFATVPNPVPPSDVPVAVSTASHVVMQEAGTVTLRVDEMHCPFACYPAVKGALEGQQNVLAVELDKQEIEGVIDNPQVVIKYEPGFDMTAAMEALAKKGFAKNSVVN